MTLCVCWGHVGFQFLVLPQLLGGLRVCWGQAKTLVGKLEHMAAKALAFPGGGKGVPVPSSTAADPHCGDEVRNVGLLELEITVAARLPTCLWSCLSTAGWWQ